MFRLPDWTVEFGQDIPYTETTVGVYVGRDGDNAIINFRDSSASVRMATRYRPVPGDPVNLTWINGRLRVTGPARAHSSTGKVTAVDPIYVTVTCDNRSYRLPYAISLVGQMKAGDSVQISWEGNAYVKDKVTADTPDEPATPRLTVDQKNFELLLFAKDSGSFWKEKWRSPDVIAEYGGAWFYSRQLRDSLRDDAQILSVEIYLPLRTAKGGLSKVGKHSQATRPTGDISLSDLDTRKQRAGWVRLPNDWAVGWRTADGGVGISGGGDNVYKGIKADRQSGKLRIKGRQ